MRRREGSCWRLIFSVLSTKVPVLGASFKLLWTRTKGTRLFRGQRSYYLIILHVSQFFPR